MRHTLHLVILGLLLTGCHTTSSTSGNQSLEAERRPLEAEEQSLEAAEQSWEAAEPEFLPYEASRYARAAENELAVFQRSSTSSPIVARLNEGEEIITYSRWGSFFAVADTRGEPLGFVLQRGVKLDYSRPAPRIERREDQGQRSTPMPAFSYKDPAVAHVLSFLITGGGQIYAGKPGKGATLLAIGAAAPLTGALLSDTNCEEWLCDDINYTPLYVGFGISAASWLYSFSTAGRDARQINRARGFNFSAMPAAVPDGKSVRPGLALSLEW